MTPCQGQSFFCKLVFKAHISSIANSGQFISVLIHNSKPINYIYSNFIYKLLRVFLITLHIVKLGRFSKFGFSVYSCPIIFGLFELCSNSFYVKKTGNSKATLSGASVYARQHLFSVTGITKIGEDSMNTVLFKPYTYLVLPIIFLYLKLQYISLNLP